MPSASGGRKSPADEERAPVMLAGVSLGRFPHVCALFKDKEEETASLQGFIREGIDAGEKAFHIVSPEQREEHRDRLRRSGLDVEAIERSGQLEVVTWDEVYFRGGRFDEDETIAAILQILDQAKRDGFPRTRLVGVTPWGADGRTDVKRFIAYEARVSEALRHYEDPVICVYDRRNLHRGIIADLLRTHPVAIVNGAGVENPFFSPPPDFLGEIAGEGRPRQ